MINNRIIWSIAGTLFGLLFPLLLFGWRLLEPRTSIWIKWVKSEWARTGEIYFIVGGLVVALFAVVGYLLGRRYDLLEERADAIQESNLELDHKASTDSLTGLFNGRYMRDQLSIELDNAHKSPLSCLLLDIDHFKKVNDTHGHPFGDEVLIRIAQLLKKSVRKFDAVGRLGGEEFLIILADIRPEKALEIGNRIRENIQTQEFLAGEKMVTVTASVGISSSRSPELENIDALLKAADEAMYQAKKAGRNRTVLWGAPSKKGDSRVETASPPFPPPSH